MFKLTITFFLTKYLQILQHQKSDFEKYQYNEIINRTKQW